jgi:hypothetical protein
MNRTPCSTNRREQLRPEFLAVRQVEAIELLRLLRFVGKVDTCGTLRCIRNASS